jgi:ketosteroid isomerase-like protein
MRGILVAVSILIQVSVGACAQENDLAATEAIDDAVGRLDEAFEARDAEGVKALMTADHVAVSPYYGTPQSVDQVIATLPDLKIKQTNLSEPTVTLLGPESAMRTLTAKLEGTFADKPISDKVFITSVLAKQDGKWVERFYQVTNLAP